MGTCCSKSDPTILSPTDNAEIAAAVAQEKAKKDEPEDVVQVTDVNPVVTFPDVNPSSDPGPHVALRTIDETRTMSSIDPGVLHPDLPPPSPKILTTNKRDLPWRDSELENESNGTGSQCDEVVDDWLAENDDWALQTKSSESGSSANDEQHDDEPEEELSIFLQEHLALYTVMKQVPLFCNLSQTQQERVLRNLKPATFSDKECVVRQGEHGTHFYMIVKGEAVVTKNVDGREIMLTHLYSGHYFGELALLYDDARTATVVASGELELMYLTRADFQRIGQVHLSLMLKQVPLLAQLNSRDQDAVLNRLQPASFAKDEYIVRQGDEGDRFYIITRGEAVVLENDDAENESSELTYRELTRLYEGHVFGEMSLIYNEPRTASVKAVGDVKCLYLTKKDFQECLNSEKFNHYIQQAYNEKAEMRALRNQQRLRTNERMAMIVPTKGANTIEARETKTLIKARLANGEKVVNKYVIKGLLGRGRFGRVHLAQNEQDGKLYSIKIMTKTFVSYLAKREDHFEDTLRTEVAIMKKLFHPNIVRLVEVIDDPSSQKIYLIQEYVERGNLMHVLKQDHPLQEDRIRRYFHDLLCGIKYLHFNRVIHRDIKPENLLVSKDDTIKIADFGAADMFSHESEMFRDAKGTPAFMAPEVFNINAEYIGPAADIWSLGATLFMLVVGSPPWTGSNEIELAKNIQCAELVFPELVERKPIQPHLRNLLQRMLTKDPVNRITLDEVIHHEWVTKEGSLPVAMASYEGKISITVTKQESVVAIQNMPQKIDLSFTKRLQKAHNLLKKELSSPTAINGSKHIRDYEDESEKAIAKKVSTESMTVQDGTNHLISAWRHHRRAGLVNDHEGLSDRSKNMLMDQKRIALSVDRAEVSEIIMSSNDTVISPRSIASRSIPEDPLDSRMWSNKSMASVRSDTDRPALSRKSDFVMVTSEVMRGDQGDIQKRKVLFQARETNFSIASNLTGKKKKRHSATPFSSFQSKTSSMSDDGHEAEARRRSSLSSADFRSLQLPSERGDGILEGVIHEVVEEKERSQSDIESDSSGDSCYSDVDADVDIENTFDDLIRTPRSMRFDSDEDLTLEKSVLDARSKEMRKIVVPPENENLELGIRFIAAERKGKRPTMEDRSVSILKYTKEQYSFFAIYDGHSGEITSSSLQKSLHHKIEGNCNFPADVSQSILCGCAEMEKELLAAENHRIQEYIRNRQQRAQDSIDTEVHGITSSGATAVIAIFARKEGVIYAHVANVGDCRAVICRGNVAVDITTDHKAAVRTERKRIEKAGGFVHNGRLNGVLAVSRAFGDATHKSEDAGDQLIAVPDINTIEISEDDEFLLLASDGLFDVLSSQQAVNFILNRLQKNQKLADVVDELVEKSLSLYCHDNVSVQIICLRQS